MKNLIFTSLAFFTVSIAFSQKHLKIKFNHLYDGEAVVFDEAIDEQSGYDFDISRLEYYLSEFSISHDGGTQTLLPDTWFLVNAKHEYELWNQNQ